MADKSRLSMASSSAIKGGNEGPQLARRFIINQSRSSLSNADDLREERIELENLLRLEDLENLRSQGFDSEKKLTKDEFIEFLRNNLHRGRDQDYEELFELVDVTKEGFINWDKLANYLMLKLYDNDDREKASSVPNWRTGRSIHNSHRDSIRRLQHLESFGRYISISKEGTVCIYNDQMQLYKSSKATTESCKMRDLWITDFVLMPNVSKVAIAYTSKELIIYDMTSKLELSLAYRVVGIDATPFCLDYWFDPENTNDAILCWGDVKGNVHALLFNSAIIALFERPSQQTSGTAYNRVHLDDIDKGNYKNATHLTYHAHSEWTRKVKYAEHLECFISCSTNPKTALVFGWMDKSGLTVRVNYSVRIRQLRDPSIVEIPQGLNSFDYSRSLNLLATAGVDCQVCLWNPFVLSKPNGILRGHMKPILFVQFMSNRGQLLSLSKDKILRIWDVQLQICLQRLSNTFPRGPEVDIFCWFDEARNRLFATFRTHLCMLEIKPEIKNRIMTHDRAIVAARYLSRQKQVMIVSQGGDISFWSLEGQKTKRFSDHNSGESIDITCLGFDELGEKFYTGGSDGKVRIWNYNGRVLHILDAGLGTAVEITQIEALKRRVVTVGWSKQLAVFRDIQETNDHPTLPTEWNGEKGKKEIHDDDIVCMALTLFSPQLLATGSTDGDICIWNTSSELFIRRLDQRKRRTAGSQTKLADNAADFAITTLKFLDRRMISNAGQVTTGANLVSCGGVGFVRFWNINSGKLIGEFQAHIDVSSVVMEIDQNEKHLVTGDVNGLVKIWDLHQHCVTSNNDELNTSIPPILTEFTPHADSITCLDFFEKDGRMFLLTASSDCSVALSDLHGNTYGIFGQPNQWRIDVDLSKAHEEESQVIVTKIEEENETDVLKSLDTQSQSAFSQDIDTVSTMTDEELLTRRSNVWESTSIGTSFQEKRTNRRQRNQPTLITKKDYLMWEKTGIAPGGAYGALDTFDIPQVPEQKKTSALDGGFSWNSTNLNESSRRRPAPTMIGENLKSAFDERSIFPKYILDYEAKQRQAFALMTQREQAGIPHTANPTGPSVSFQLQPRQIGDNAEKLKRQGSSSTAFSDHKATSVTSDS